jgi:L-seryl-tRNA(Ser) seleniumtransferase
MTNYRVIPSIDDLLRRPALGQAIETHGSDFVVAAVRRAADALRERLKHGADPLPHTPDEAAQWLESQTLRTIDTQLEPSLIRVINATGVILHTNLGRAPLAQAAIDAMARVAAGYSNLEYSLSEGHRGHRHVHAERLLCELTGAETAVVLNNNAGAMLATLAALCGGREVVVSRGELVEIGGGFRVPEVLAQSGASLREVGTTNRTRAADYAAAIGDRTAAILRVHPSNFRIEGFTERPALDELVTLGRRLNVPVIEDLGSGWLGGDIESPAALREEPSVGSSLAAGVDLVAFSGDKLVGGPQCGIVVGRRSLIDRIRVHPLMRALRVDKLTYAALEATLTLWLRASTRDLIPVCRMLTMSSEEIGQRADALVERLRANDRLTYRVIDGLSTIGGGSAPGAMLPTRLIAVTSTSLPVATLESRLRTAPSAVVARVQEDQLLLDLRTVGADEEPDLVRGLKGTSN